MVKRPRSKSARSLGRKAMKKTKGGATPLRGGLYIAAGDLNAVPSAARSIQPCI